MNQTKIGRALLLFWICFFSALVSSAQRTGLSSSAALASVTANYWKDILEISPLRATRAGVHTHNDQMEMDISLRFQQEAGLLYSRYLDSINSINFDSLGEQDRLVAEIFKYGLQREIDGIRIGFYQSGFAQRPVDQFVFSFPTSFATMSSGSGLIRFRTVKDYEDWLKRLQLFPNWVDTAIENMNNGIRMGNTSPRAAMKKVPDQLKYLFETPTDSSIFYKPILAFPGNFSAADKQLLKKSFTNVINQSVKPAYKKLYDYFVGTYIPNCRTSTGLIDNGNGREEYKYLVEFWATAPMDPEAIFELGLSEVARLRKEMDSIKISTGFRGDLKSFFEFIKSDPRFFPFSTEDQVLNRFRDFTAKMEPELKKKFNLLPRAGFEIRATEKFREAGANAQYNRPSVDGTQPGVFYEVIPDAKKYNYYTMETLFLHEAIPGHHFQVALQMEMDAPEFLKSSFFGAFSEGWGLYAETLGGELGMYKDPYQYFGHLSVDMERSVRLVVDVGMHYKGWSREQAIEYVLDNQPHTREIAEQRIERYMVVPAQALSYKIGEQKILELRALAEEQLGSGFDIRKFHDELLKDGAMPLSILDAKIRRWINAELLKKE